jgi:hypothetical protein
MRKVPSIAILILTPVLSLPVLAAEQPKEQPAKYTLTITGTLVNKDGTPARKTPVSAYPLDATGTAISVNA